MLSSLPAQGKYEISGLRSRNGLSNATEGSRLQHVAAHQGLTETLYESGGRRTAELKPLSGGQMKLTENIERLITDSKKLEGDKQNLQAYIRSIEMDLHNLKGHLDNENWSMPVPYGWLQSYTKSTLRHGGSNYLQGFQD